MCYINSCGHKIDYRLSEMSVTALALEQPILLDT